ncbi:MAG TPA: PNGase F N-terminal domain-containing protein, partial [Saprospiraceae bacterium]|nr:PNGase F N-terminal domain-containing protein [Saprospiraceae bacterium]
MTRYFLLFFAFFLTTSLLAQLDLSKEPITKITYLVSYNGQTDTSQNPIWVLASNNKVLVTSRDQMLGKSNYPREMMLVMPVQKIYSQYAFLNDSESVYMTDSSSIGKQQFEFSEETKQILGHTCKKAKTVINSNTIELWYTTNAGFNAAPGLLGQSLGLVLQQVRNGNTVITATDISKQNIQLPDYMTKAVSHKYNKLDYTDLLWRSRFTTIPLFDNQQINFSDTFTAREGILRFANGTIVLRKVKFPVLSATSQIFLDLSERSTGDAYDRTGTVFLIAQDKKQSFLDGLQQGASVLPSYENGNGKKYQGVITTDSYSPAAELMRFFTPFGVGHFNDRLTLKD